MFYFSIFFSPSPLIIISRYKKKHFTPLHKGRGKQPKGLRGGGASYSAFTFPAGFSFAAL